MQGCGLQRVGRGQQQDVRGLHPREAVREEAVPLEPRPIRLVAKLERQRRRRPMSIAHPCIIYIVV